LGYRQRGTVMIGGSPLFPLSRADSLRTREPFTLRVGAQELIAALSLMRIPEWETRTMDSIIYLVGLVVVIMFVLSLLGLR
jgi:hypothetical protein